MNRLDRFTVQGLGALTIIQPVGAIGLAILSPELRWGHGIMVLVSVLSAIVGYGMLSLRPWVLILFPYWIPSYVVGVFCALRASEWRILEATAMSLLAGLVPAVAYLTAKRVFGREV